MLDRNFMPMVSAIKYGMTLRGINARQMAFAMRENVATFYRRLQFPEDFTLGELLSVSAKLHIPLEKLINGDVK